jgi:hypothetical protein
MDIVFKIHNFFVNRVYAGSLGKELEDNLKKLEEFESEEEGIGALIGEEGFISAIVNIAVPAAILCLIVLVVYAGYMLISSQGNPDKLKEGKEVLTNAIIGFFVIVLSTVILLLISDGLGLDIYK